MCPCALEVGASIIGLHVNQGLETLGGLKPYNIIQEWHLVLIVEVLVLFQVAP